MYDNLLLRLCEFAVATRTGCVKVNYAKKDHPTKGRWSFSYAHKLTDNLKCGII